jgi:type I restriction enzyme, S subunit
MHDNELLSIGWLSCEFQDVVESFKRGPFGSAIKKEFFVPDGYKVYEQKNAIYDDPSLGDYYITKEKYEELEAFHVKAGDFIVSCSGTIGKISQLPPSSKKGVINQALLRIRLNPELLELRFFLYLFRSESFQRKVLVETKGSAMKNIAGVKDLKPIPFFLPPLNEQKRIVAKIEELFGELETAVASLKKAQAQLKTYRQALLKHAFEGKLTAVWRAAHADQLEDAHTLLQCIQAERQTRYKAELAAWEANGKQRPKPRPPKDLPPLTPAELDELPQLPAGWAWERVGQLSEVSGGLTKNQKRNGLPNKRPFLRVANVYANRLDLEDVHEIGITDGEIDRVLLQKGDLLIVEGNGSIEQIGRVAIWDGSVEGCVHQNHLIKARPYPSIKIKFILYFLMSELGRRFIVQQASSTSGLHTLSLSKVDSLFVPVCLTAEQNEIILALDAFSSQIDALEQTITTALQQAESLRQSILKKAFSGQLVPQEPNDEPAAALLARIRATKESAHNDKV